jgi:hypothetical protein
MRRCADCIDFFRLEHTGRPNRCCSVAGKISADGWCVRFEYDVSDHRYRQNWDRRRIEAR